MGPPPARSHANSGINGANGPSFTGFSTTMRAGGTANETEKLSKQLTAFKLKQKKVVTKL